MIAIRNTSSIDKESRIPNPVPSNPESTAWNPETKIVLDSLARGEV